RNLIESTKEFNWKNRRIGKVSSPVIGSNLSATMPKVSEAATTTQDYHQTTSTSTSTSTSEPTSTSTSTSTSEPTSTSTSTSTSEPTFTSTSTSTSETTSTSTSTSTSEPTSTSTSTSTSEPTSTSTSTSTSEPTSTSTSTSTSEPTFTSTSTSTSETTSTSTYINIYNIYLYHLRRIGVIRSTIHCARDKSYVWNVCDKNSRTLMAVCFSGITTKLSFVCFECLKIDSIIYFYNINTNIMARHEFNVVMNQNSTTFNYRKRQRGARIKLSTDDLFMYNVRRRGVVYRVSTLNSGDPDVFINNYTDTMIQDDKKHIRQLGLRRILKARQIDERRKTKSQFPVHTQAVERCVKLVTEASGNVCGVESLLSTSPGNPSSKYLRLQNRKQYNRQVQLTWPIYSEFCFSFINRKSKSSMR
ncbi:hypothetical protein L9F63_022414, partial [Diploptera punctata]